MKDSYGALLPSDFFPETLDIRLESFLFVKLLKETCVFKLDLVLLKAKSQVLFSEVVLLLPFFDSEVLLISGVVQLGIEVPDLCFLLSKNFLQVVDFSFGIFESLLKQKQVSVDLRLAANL